MKDSDHVQMDIMYQVDENGILWLWHGVMWIRDVTHGILMRRVDE